MPTNTYMSDVALPTWLDPEGFDPFEDLWGEPPPYHRPGSRADWRQQRAEATSRAFEVTPLWRAWRRRAYERVVMPLWSVLVEDLQPVDQRGRYPARLALTHLPQALRRYAEQAAPADLEAYLYAQGQAFQEAVGHVEQGCHCRPCARQRRLARNEARVPRDERIRAAFVKEAAYHLELVLAAPNRYDRRLGAPPLRWDRSPLPRREAPHAG
jgi:hypothetical protein